MQGLHIGISKRELMEDYYPDELTAIFEAWGDLHGVERDEPPEQVDVETFLKM